MIIEISLNSGVKKVVLSQFAALDGWELQHSYAQFSLSSDKAFRRAYTMEVLSYAKVIVNDQELPLSTDALIDNHLGSWDNVKFVFESVLRHNGIEPLTHADNPTYWTEVGNQIAIAFLASCSHLIEPAMKNMAATMESVAK
jgi:hypothetical protein